MFVLMVQDRFVRLPDSGFDEAEDFWTTAVNGDDEARLQAKISVGQNYVNLQANQ